TFNPQYRSPEKGKYRLYIPNEEIKECFKSKILNFYKNNTVMKNRTDELIKGLFTGDAELVETSLCGLLAKYVSIRDFSVNAPKENYYHGFVNGLLINATSYMEEHKSNMESGDGYADIIAISKSDDTVVILELKHTDKPFGTKTTLAAEALEQVLRVKYADAFIDNIGIKNVYAYGICFYKKSCAVKGQKLK
ncbi:MAG: PD-(D/E)XK nuclease domain-containing protein, partial [Ruminobacter sp.]|nr:PD-(D/E)XK nuclease domain-containing protein [Ruminobacter sp.]